MNLINAYHIYLLSYDLPPVMSIEIVIVYFSINVISYQYMSKATPSLW
jgi:hypothetical protein